MSAHIILLSLILFGGLVFYSKGLKYPYADAIRNRNFVIFSEFLIFLLVGLRSSVVGIDTARYEIFFERISKNPDYIERLDWAIFFRILVTVAERLNSFQLILIVCALITSIGFGYFVLSITEENETAFWYIFYFITLGSYFNSMNLIRQFCAMAITINIYAVLHKDQSKKSYAIALALFLIGFGFHATAFLSLVYFIPFLIKSIDKRVIISISFIAAAIIIGYTRLIPVIIRIWDRYERYSEDIRLTTGSTGIFAISMIIVRIVMILVVLLMDAKKSDNTEIYRQTVFTVVSTALFILQAQTQFALRIGYYYEVLFPLYIPTFIRKMQERKTKMALYCLFALYAFIYFIYMMKWGGTRSNRATVPYYFFWETVVPEWNL